MKKPVLLKILKNSFKCNENNFSSEKITLFFKEYKKTPPLPPMQYQTNHPRSPAKYLKNHIREKKSRLEKNQIELMQNLVEAEQKTFFVFRRKKSRARGGKK